MYKVSNQVTLIGRLGTDPKISGGENLRAHFSLATNEEFGRGEDRTERTDWHDIVCWRGLVKSCEHLAAGDRIAIAGKLRSQDWTDPSGQKRRSIEVHADDIVFLDVKSFRARQE
jgi:single-strand DNA-binding protein